MVSLCLLCAQQDAVIEAPAVAVPREKEIKPVKKPDEEAFKARMSEQDERIAAKQARLEQIKQIFDSRDGQRGAESSAAALSKAKFQEARAESRRILQERRSIYDQINAAEELKKQQQDLTQRLRSELPFFSVDEIERRIKQLEMSQQTSSLTIKEDRKVMDDIRRLNANKPMIKQYDEAQESLRGVKEHHTTLFTQIKAKNAELASAKEVEEGLRAEMDDARARDDAKKSDLPALHKERDECRREMSEIRLELKHMRDEFSEQRKEWFTYQKQMRDQKQRELLERKAARQAEISAWRKLLEEEEARRDPWEEEKLLCEQLISYVEKYLPIKIVETAVNAAEEAAAKVRAEIQAGGGRKKAHEDDEYLIALRSNKGKKKGGGGGKSSTPPTPKTKVVKMTHAPESFESFGKLGFKPPLDTGECPQLYKALLEKREWLKTAPPKQKNRKFDPSATPSAEARGPAEGKTECHFDLSTFDKEEVEKKKAAEDKKQAERDAIEAENLKRMEAIEKSGKRAAGGLHKFDPDEVDVNGGDATADDLMAAFGFSDMGGEMKGAEVIGDEAAAEAAMEVWVCTNPSFTSLFSCPYLPSNGLVSQ
tara:strand:- start:1069 stop:2856 length:1788 start_codon:yes stop_codon:yes gene_type:complete